MNTIKMTRANLGAPLLASLLVLCINGGATGQQRSQDQATAAGDKYGVLIRSLKGPDLFGAYCASCHGVDGRGAGPVAAALKAKVPDLTLLAMQNHGEFPAARVQKIIAGDSVIAAHGSREMPIWGPIFHQVEEDVDRGNVRMQNLVEYLRSIQSVASARPSPGAELYQQNCAACHGNDLRGNHSAPPPFGDTPDLTALAKRHGGAFPDAYVSRVLKNGVKISAHGTAEMPIWGSDFRSAHGLNTAQVDQYIKDLVNYIQSQQEN